MSEQNVYVALLAVAGAEAITLALLVWHRKVGQRSGLLFWLLMFGVSIWSLAYAFELAAPRLEDKLFWVRLEYIGIVSVPVVFFWFVAEYLSYSQWMTLRYLVLSSIIPLSTLALNWTNFYHGLIYREVSLDTSGGFPNLEIAYGGWFWVHFAYSYILMLGATALLVRAVVRYPDIYRGQAWTLLIAAFAPWVGNAIYIFDLGLFPGLDLTPFAFTVTGLAMAWSLIRYRLMEIVPAARDYVVESLSDAVIVVDPRNRVVDLNPAARELLGQNGAGAIGRTLGEVMPQQRGLIAEFRETTSTLREIMVGALGQERYFELRISSLRDGSGRITGRVVLLRDITQSKKAERDLRRAHEHALEALRIKSRILAMVSHDFRTPLSAISGYVDMLQHGVTGPMNEKQLQFLERIQLSTGQLTNLVTNLLDQAQIDEGEITINWSRFSPAALMDGIETVMRPRAQAKNLKLISVVATPPETMLFGDLSRVIQVTNNLVDNALKFTEQGSVTVRVYQHTPDTWGIEITDTGPGMEDPVLAHIFDPFWQADASVTRGHSGVGLGLTIARQLTALMGGRIDVQSKLGVGTTFNVILPFQSAKERQVEKVSSAGR